MLYDMNSYKSYLNSLNLEMATNVKTTEISKNIFLHKNQYYKDAEEKELAYNYNVEVNTFQIVEFTVDFTGSECITLEGSNSLTATTIIQPFTTKTVATLRLSSNWKIKSKFRFDMKNPPIEQQKQYIKSDSDKLDLNISNALKYENLPTDHMPVTDIKSMIKTYCTNYIDLDFMPTDPSVDKENLFELDIIVHWRRPESMGTEVCVLPTILQSNEIKEGQLSFPWLTGALATLSELPPLIERLLMTKEKDDSGCYKVKECYFGQWKVITLDDYIPCSPGGLPLFSMTSKLDLWIMLLEKAYAKMHGSYSTLKNGHTYEALMDLTGCPCKYFSFSDHYIIQMLKNDDLWLKIKEFNERSFLISLSLAPSESEAEEGSLLPSHSYTVLDICETKSAKLFKIRNIWGAFEWDGDWSNNSPLWTAELRKELNNGDEDETVFWMNINDVVTHFSGMEVCYTKNWQELRVKGKFVTVSDSTEDRTLSKWYYSFDLTEPTEVIITLHQEDEHGVYTSYLRPYIDISLTIAKKNEDNIELIDVKDYAIERQSELEIRLEPGSYIVLPRTTGCLLNKKPESEPESKALIDENGDLTTLMESIIIDLFNRYEILMTGELGYSEFKGLMNAIGLEITEDEFKDSYLSKYCSTQRGITLRGLKQMFKDLLTKEGEESILKMLSALGYDSNLCNSKSRMFLLSFHTDAELSVVVRDALQTDIDNKINILIIDKFGQDGDNKGGVRSTFTFSE